MKCRHSRIVMWLTTLLLSLAASSTGWAQSEHPFVIQQWHAPEQCGDVAAFTERIATALQLETPDANARYAEVMDVSIAVQKRRKRWILTLTTKTSEGQGSRQLRGRDCESLLASAAIVISLSISPELLYINELQHEVLVSPANEPIPEKRVITKSAKQRDDDEVPNLSPADPRFRPVDAGISTPGSPRTIGLVALYTSIATDIGTLPRPALGLALEASRQGADYRVSFRLTRWAQQNQYIEATDGKGGHFDYIESSMQLCRRLWRSLMPGGACLSVSLGRLSADAIALDNPISQVHPMANVGGGLYFEIAAVSRWHLRVHGEAITQLLLPEYSAMVREEGPGGEIVSVLIHKPNFLVFRLAGSLGARF